MIAHVSELDFAAALTAILLLGLLSLAITLPNKFWHPDSN